MLGGEFPGAQGSVKRVQDPHRGEVLRMDCDFTGGGRYMGMLWSGRLPQAEKIAFWMKGSAGIIRIKDATHQTLAGRYGGVHHDGWSLIEVALEDGRFEAHWGGANDGKVHFPITQVLLATENHDPKKDSFLLSDPFFRVSSADPALGWRMDIKAGPPAGVALLGEKAVYEITLVNRLRRDRGGHLDVRIESDRGEVSHRRLDVNVPPWGQLTKTIEFPTDRLGYWSINASLVTGGKTVLLGGVDSALAVVRKPWNYGQEDRNSYFGMGGAGTNFEAARRLGCKSVRPFVFWSWSGDEEQPFADPATYREHGMDTLYTIELGYTPARFEWTDAPDPRMRLWPAPEHMDAWRDYVKRFVAHMGKDIGAIEIENEPDLTVWRDLNMDIKEAATLYVKYLRAAYEGAKAADPDVVVGGPGVSGGEIEPGMRQFLSLVLAEGHDVIDFLPCHAYASPRRFGPGERPRWPEEHGMARNLRWCVALLEKHGIPPRIWIGEIGWGLKRNVRLLGQYSLDHAACVARSLIIGMTVPGVEKYFWFYMPPTNGGADDDYGLFRDDPARRSGPTGPCEYPIPSAVAYATCAYMLHHAKVVRQIDLSPAARGWRFDRAEQKLSVVPLWGLEGTLRLQADVPASARVVDPYNRVIARGPKLDLELGLSPIYVAIPLAEGDALENALNAATVVADRPVTIQKAYFTTDRALRVRLRNHLRQPQEASVSVAGHSLRPLLEPGDTELPVDLGRSFAGAGPTRLQITVVAQGKSESASVEAELLPLARIDKVAIDGKLDETASLKPLKVVDRIHVLPPDPHVGWSGADDLSLEGWLGWNEQILYFAARVTDDVHHAPDASSNFWHFDSIQLAVDPQNDSTRRYNTDDREIGFVLGPDGPRAHSTYPVGAAQPCELKIVRHGKTTIYEAAVTWQALGLPAPKPRRVMAINLMANENDGHGRMYWMGLTPGIGEEKRPEIYRQFVLMP